MIISLVFQFKILIFSIIAGFITGVLFDFYRIIRGLNIKKFFIIIEDLLFWILCSLIVFTFLLYTNYAFIGVYVYLYITLGIYIYIKLFSKIFLKVQHIIIKRISKFFRLIVHSISYPFKLIFYNGNKNP